MKIAASGEPCAPERMAECFAWLCDRAADAGTSVALEITPFGQIASLRDGIALIEAGGRLTAVCCSTPGTLYAVGFHWTRSLGFQLTQFDLSNCVTGHQRLGKLHGGYGQ